MPIGFPRSGSDITSLTGRVSTLEDTTHEYEIYESIASGTGGNVTMPAHGTIILDQYPGAADCLVCKTDPTTGRPIDEIALTAAGVAITGTLDIAGVYTLSGTPSSYPVGLVFQIKLSEKYKTAELADSRILNEQSVDKVNMDQSTPQILTGHGRGTRIISGGAVTQNSATSINISAGNGVIYNSTTQIETPVSWSAFTNYSLLTNINAGYDASHIFIGSGGTVFTTTSEPVNGTLRDYIYLNKVAHRSGGSITATRDIKHYGEEALINIAELAQAIGSLNIEDNTVSYYSTALQIQKSAGVSYRYAAGGATNRKNPSFTTDIAIAPITFTYCQRKTGGGVLYTPSQTSIIPGRYDVGNSTLASVGVAQFTMQRVLFFPVTNSVYIFYGRSLFGSMDAAVSAIATSPFDIDTDFFSGAIMLAYICVKGNATNLSLATSAVFTPAGKFSGAGGGGSAGITTLEAAYDNSVQPQIITNATKGAVQIQRGSAADTDKVFEILNGAGTSTASIQGDGGGYFAGKIGVGTASPDGKLTVDADGTFVSMKNMTTGLLIVSGANYDTNYLSIYPDNTNDCFKIASFNNLSGVKNLVLNPSGGNVGIGEASPDYKLDVNGSFGFTPGASVTPVDNGDVVFELTSNTTLTIKAKGSDGTVRSVALTLA